MKNDRVADEHSSIRGTLTLHLEVVDTEDEDAEVVDEVITSAVEDMVLEMEGVVAI